MAEVLPERPGSAVPPSPVDVPVGAVDGEPLDEIAPSERRLSPGQLARRRFRRHKLAMASLIVLVALFVLAAAAPLLSSRGYVDQNLLLTLRRPGDHSFLGTDTLGRDQWARLLYGGRISLSVGLAVAVISAGIGVFVGSIAGYYGGRVDNVLMRITDTFLAVPQLVVLLIFSKILGGTVLDVVVLLSVFFWMGMARIVRGMILSLKEKEYVEAARASGASTRRIILRHLLPNCLGPIVVNVTLTVAQAIILESTLSFLGFGIRPPVPTWGNMLDAGRPLTTVAPWLVWYPGLAILITVLAVNFLGDGMSDALDPTRKDV